MMLIASIDTEINVIYVSTVFRDNLVQIAFSVKCEVKRPLRETIHW